MNKNALKVDFAISDKDKDLLLEQASLARRLHPKISDCHVDYLDEQGKYLATYVSRYQGGEIIGFSHDTNPLRAMILAFTDLCHRLQRKRNQEELREALAGFHYAY